MIEVTKTNSHVLVRVKLDKRLLAKEKKVYLYAHDAYAEAVKKFPEIKIKNIAEEQHVISNVSSPHEAMWKFAIEKLETIKKPLEQQEKTEEKKEEKKDLKFEPKRTRLERKEGSKKDSIEQQ
jgi:hypothetical protein